MFKIEKELQMDLFKGQNLLTYRNRFKTDLKSKKYLSEIKAESGYSHKKCDHPRFQERKDFSRICNLCIHIARILIYSISKG
jgi:hypothetical protein